MKTNPKSEIRSPKSRNAGRNPKPETPLRAAGKNYPSWAGQFFRNSGFGLLSDFSLQRLLAIYRSSAFSLF
jgi:hypothetical protein